MGVGRWVLGGGCGCGEVCVVRCVWEVSVVCVGVGRCVWVWGGGCECGKVGLGVERWCECGCGEVVGRELGVGVMWEGVGDGFRLWSM